MKAFSAYTMKVPWWLYIAFVFVLALSVEHFKLWSGFIQLSVWQGILVVLALTHITIASVTIYLHRNQAHNALVLHPVVSHFFRFWLWLTTGMVTKEWAAIHRKHHAKVETKDDPHSPKIYGLPRVLFAGVMLYVREAKNKETIERYGRGTPDDWMEKNLYTPYQKFGVVLMLFINFLLFGPIIGVFVVWLTQMWWIPFLAAGVINGVGHFFGFFGYRSFKSRMSPTALSKHDREINRHLDQIARNLNPSSLQQKEYLASKKLPPEDWSTNIIPWGILIGGEELHNNHHAYPTSAKLSAKWYEFDIGWMYIRILEMLGLARVKYAYGRTKGPFDV